MKLIFQDIPRGDILKRFKENVGKRRVIQLDDITEGMKNKYTNDTYDITKYTLTKILKERVTS